MNNKDPVAVTAKPLRSTVIGPTKPRLWQVLGPGLITGASDDDPSGIATYSQAGAQFGFGLAWSLLFTYPLMFVVQAISARIGRTTGLGLAANIRRHYPRSLLYTIVALVFVANTLNIGADLGAMGEATRLLTPRTPAWCYIVLYGCVSALGQIFLQHTRYVGVLKWLTLSLFAYFAVVCVVDVHWSELWTSLLLPKFSASSEFWTMVVAILGTTISPYLFLWQASQEVEDTKVTPERLPLKIAPWQGPSALARIRIDTLIGMAFSNLVALAILTTTAATLHAHGIQEITTAAQAAEALRPIAGRLAFEIFALGIVGTGLLSVPVLAGSAAYALGEACGWPVGLSRAPLQAKAFYFTIVLATTLGALANIFKLNPIHALVWAAIINGFVAVPVMALLVCMGANPKIMGQFTSSKLFTLAGWIATAVMAAAAAVMLYTSMAR